VKPDTIHLAKAIERNNATACGVIEINNGFVTIPTKKGRPSKTARYDFQSAAVAGCVICTIVVVPPESPKLIQVTVTTLLNFLAIWQCHIPLGFKTFRTY
jgi:hypothetical protein